MEDSVQRENGRHKSDQYKGAHAQWILSQNHMKDHQAIKLMQAMAEKDAAIQERNVAVAEKKQAIAQRDMAIVQRDQALNQLGKVTMERDSALAALDYARGNTTNGNGSNCPPGCTISRGTKHIHHPQNLLHPTHMPHPPYHSREMHTSDSFPISANEENVVKPRRAKRPRKDTKMQIPISVKKGKTPRKGKREGEDLNKQVSVVKQLEWKCQEMAGEDLNRQHSVTKLEWKGQALGLNQVTFDETTMPVPACSCTGVIKQCYKWGNGGWQSACCTTSLSMYPLPVMPNKRHARIGGRKMSGSAFNKLLSRLAAEGHDLALPVDLKDHWAKHGTNRYITIK